jgi:trigger factor
VEVGGISLADPQSPRQSLEITVPVDEVEAETERVIASLQKKVRIPGFRPGKVPRDLIRSRYASDIRQDVLEKLLPRHFYTRAEREGLAVVGTPNIKDVHFEKGEPLKFTADFEVAPTIELKEYKGLTVAYQEPEITDEDIQKRIDQLREQKAEYINVDPRPLVAGDHAVVSLESLSGVEQPIKQDELVLEVGGEATLADFTNNLLGASPGDQKEFDVTYPEDYGQARIAGKTIRFRATVKGVRRKEVPEVNDEFARDLGDYQNVEELREAIRKAIFSERQFFAQQEAKNKLVEQLVDAHEFPVPEAFLEHQIELSVRRQLEMLAAEGVDPRSIKLDWEKVKESQREKAIRDVKASLIINKVADAEQLFATQEEVDRELQRLARQEREPVAATRKRLEKDDGIRHIANRIRTEKTLNLLFEQARKEAPAETPAAE